MTTLTETAWSMLDDRPVVIEDQKTGMRLCCWAGVPMDLKTALLVYAKKIIHTTISETMANAAAQDFEQAHALGFFDHDIATIYSRHYYYQGVISLMEDKDPNIFHRLSRYHPSEILACFKQSHRSVREYDFKPGVEHAF